MHHVKFLTLIGLAASVVSTPALAATQLTGNYFIRPYVTLGNGVIDGYEANGATTRSEGFANIVTSTVDLDQGVARTYVNVSGVQTAGSAAGVFGDTVAFYGSNGDPVNVSYAFDGTIFATARTDPQSLFQIGVYATLYVFDANAGATYNNFTSRPGSLVSQVSFLDYSNPSSIFNTTVNETLAGSFTPLAGHSYSLFSSLSVFSSTNDNAASATLDFRNTGRFGIDAPAGVTYASASGVFLDSVDAVAVPEPAAWAMMISGFGAIGFTSRRRRQSVRVRYV